MGRQPAPAAPRPGGDGGAFVRALVQLRSALGWPRAQWCCRRVADRCTRTDSGASPSTQAGPTGSRCARITAQTATPDLRVFDAPGVLVGPRSHGRSSHDGPCRLCCSSTTTTRSAVDSPVRCLQAPRPVSRFVLLVRSRPRGSQNAEHACRTALGRGACHAGNVSEATCGKSSGRSSAHGLLRVAECPSFVAC